MKPTREEQVFADLLEGMEREAPEELAGLVRLASALEHVRPTGPEPAFKADLRRRLITEAARRRPWTERVREAWAERDARMRRSFRLVCANAVAAAVLLAGGAVLAASHEAIPGQALYPVKKARQAAQLLVTRGAEARGLLQLEFARESLEEIRLLAQAGQADAELYIGALNDMDARTLDATRLLIEAYGRTRDRLPLDRLTQFAVAQRLGLEVLLDLLPPRARRVALDSMDILTRVQERVAGILAGCPCPANPLVPPGTEPGTPPAASEAPACPCAEIRGDGEAAPPPPGPGDGGNGTDTDGGGGAEPPPAQGVIPPIEGTDLDETVNRIIDDVLETLPPPPVPLPTGSPAPL